MWVEKSHLGYLGRLLRGGEILTEQHFERWKQGCKELISCETLQLNTTVTLAHQRGPSVLVFEFLHNGHQLYQTNEVLPLLSVL